MSDMLRGISFSEIAYRHFGKCARRLTPHFQDLLVNLAKAGKGMALEMYLSESIFASVIVALSCLIGTYGFWALTMPSRVVFLVIDPTGWFGGPWGFPLFLPDPLHVGLTYVLATTVASGLLTFVVWYMYPGFRAKARTDGIEVALPYVTNYMSAMASSGLPIEKMIQSLLESRMMPVITPEIGMIVRNIDLLGMDTLTALRDVANKTPSRSLADLFRGIAETVRSGGDLGGYLRENARWFMRERMIKFKEKLESISLLAEFFVTLAIAAPLFVVLLVPLMGILGEISFGAIPPGMILPLTLFGFIPLVSVVILIAAYMVMSGE